MLIRLELILVAKKIKPKGKSGPTETENSAVVKDIESKLRSALGTKVQMRTFSEGGEIRIQYFTDEDLERILALLSSSE